MSDFEQMLRKAGVDTAADAIGLDFSLYTKLGMAERYQEHHWSVIQHPLVGVVINAVPRLENPGLVPWEEWFRRDGELRHHILYTVKRWKARIRGRVSLTIYCIQVKSWAHCGMSRMTQTLHQYDSGQLSKRRGCLGCFPRLLRSTAEPAASSRRPVGTPRISVISEGSSMMMRPSTAQLPRVPTRSPMKSSTTVRPSLISVSGQPL